MRGVDEAFVHSLAAEVRTVPGLSERERQTTIDLLYVVTAAILGCETARRLFHMESIIQDPNVQELMREWEDKGRVKGLVKGRLEGRALEARSLLYKVLAARSFLVPPDVAARIDAEHDLARLESWLEAAVTAAMIGDVFRDG
jgi:hypothetical protein